MTILTTRWLVLSVLSAGLLASAALRAEDSPHWERESCGVCHTTASPMDGAAALKAADPEAVCEGCHGDRGDALPCRHSSGIPVGDKQIAAQLQSSIKDGQVVCSTCHDIVYQCKNARPHFSLQNRGFLRDRTSRNAADYCFKCHDKSAYAKLSPHQGVGGSPTRPTCQLCHEDFPRSDSSGELLLSFNMSRDLNDFNMPHDLNDACRGCHNTPPHPKGMSFSKKAPDGWIHLTQPSDDVLAKMRSTKERTGIELPLDAQTGELFCGTCHNPHEFKIGGEHGSESKNTRHRLRMDNICQACHEK